MSDDHYGIDRLEPMQLVAHRSGEENDRRIGVLLSEIEELKGQMMALQEMDEQGVPVYESDDEGTGLADEPVDFAVVMSSAKRGHNLVEAEPPRFGEFSEFAGAPSPPPSNPLDATFEEYDDELQPAVVPKEEHRRQHHDFHPPDAIKKVVAVSWVTCDSLLYSMRDVLAGFERAVSGHSAPFTAVIPAASDSQAARPRTPPRDPYVDAYMKMLVLSHKKSSH